MLFRSNPNPLPKMTLRQKLLLLQMDLVNAFADVLLRPSPSPKARGDRKNVASAAAKDVATAILPASNPARRTVPPLNKKSPLKLNPLQHLKQRVLSAVVPWLIRRAGNWLTRRLRRVLMFRST